MIVRLNRECLSGIAREILALGYDKCRQVPADLPIAAQIREISAVDRARIDGYVMGYQDHAAEIDAADLEPDYSAGPIAAAACYIRWAHEERRLRSAVRVFFAAAVAFAVLVLGFAWVGNQRVANDAAAARLEGGAR